jgi:hypothetical protein
VTVLRLPHNNTRWVWEIDKDHARCIVEVMEVRFNGEEWWVTTRHLPEVRGRDIGRAWNTLDRFWEAVTPIGGRRDDLSNPISEEQYRKMPHEQLPKE